MNVGDTFVNRDPGHPLHLWFVCTLPDSQDRVVILNLTSLESCVDPTCLIVEGDHRFVRHDSLIEYQHGRIVPVSFIEAAFEASLFFSDEVASDELIAKIREGASRSEFTPGDVRDAVGRVPLGTYFRGAVAESALQHCPLRGGNARIW